MCHHHVFSREYSHVCVSAVRDIETMAYRVLRYAKRIALAGCLLLLLSYALFNSQNGQGHLEQRGRFARDARGNVLSALMQS